MDSDKIINVISKHVVNGKEVTAECELFDDLGLSSLDMINVLCDLEHELKISVNLTDMVGVVTVGDLTERIQRYVK